jgi:hypothetical protein
MKRFLIIILFLPILGLLACTNSNNQKNDDFLIQAEICGMATRINFIDTVDRKYFFVRIQMTNQSTYKKLIWMYSCSWMNSWKVIPNSYIFYNEGCDKNVPRNIELMPKESISFNVILIQNENHPDTSFIQLVFADFSASEIRNLIPPPLGNEISSPNPQKIYSSNWISTRYYNNTYSVIK